MTLPRLAVGDPAPLFELPDTEGTAHRLEPGAHAASVVVFTANGCPFARAWHGRLQEVVRDYADRDVPVFQIISNDDADHPEDSVEGMRARAMWAGWKSTAWNRPCGLAAANSATVVPWPQPSSQ